MTHHHNHHSNLHHMHHPHKIKTIYSGEFYVTNRNEIISTILGSCIAVCLFDRVNKICGMNHFMLPEKVSGEIFKKDSSFQESFLYSDSLRYGAYSMELLINKIIKLGGNKKFLEAKVFGGGRVLHCRSDKESVGDQNINFALAYLKAENIEIRSKDIGGDSGRKIYYHTIDHSIYVKKIPIRSVPESESIVIKRTTDDVMLFDN